MSGKGDIEILDRVSKAFTFNPSTGSFYFFGISPGDKIARAVELLGQPRRKVKSKGKVIHTFPLRDIRDDDRPYDYIFAKFSTKENIILSITYEFRLVDTKRHIQEGLKAFKGSIARTKRF